MSDVVGGIELQQDFNGVRHRGRKYAIEDSLAELLNASSMAKHGAANLAPQRPNRGTVMTDVPTSGLGDITTETTTSEPERAKRTKWWILAVLAVAIIVVVVLIVVQVSKSGPSYHVTYTGVQAVGPNATRVSVVVRNTGGSTGTPTCTVRATANGGAELGTGTFHEDQRDQAGRRHPLRQYALHQQRSRWTAETLGHLRNLPHSQVVGNSRSQRQGLPGTSRTDEHGPHPAAALIQPFVRAEFSDYSLAVSAGVLLPGDGCGRMALPPIPSPSARPIPC